MTKHLVFDPAVIRTAWDDPTSTSAELIGQGSKLGGRYWINAASLAELAKAVERPDNRQRANDPGRPDPLIRLLDSFNILTDHGFEQADLCRHSSAICQAQLAAAAASLPAAQTCLVSDDPDFETLGKVSLKRPSQALQWLAEETDPPPAMIDLVAQQARLRPDLEQAIEGVLRHGRYVNGPEIAALERRLAGFICVEYGLGVSSGTAGLLIALLALGVGPGDEVITSPFTFVASAETIALTGARPVFVDIDPKTYNLDPEQLTRAITPASRAVVAVNLYGQCADFDRINAVAGQYGLPVIEDGCQSLGASYKGRKACGLATIGVTSFFPSKPLGGYGDGGAVFTNDPALAEVMAEIRDHGQTGRYRHQRLGLNGRLDSLQAAILLAKFDAFEQELHLRRQLAERYTGLLQSVPGLVTPYVENHNSSVYAQYTLRLEERDRLAKGLRDSGIATAVHYPVPLHLQPVFQSLGYRPGDFPVAEAAARQVLSLPIGPYLTPSQQQYVVEQLYYWMNPKGEVTNGC